MPCFQVICPSLLQPDFYDVWLSSNMAGYLVGFKNFFLGIKILNKWVQLLKLLKKEILSKISNFINLYLFSLCLIFFLLLKGASSATWFLFFHQKVPSNCFSLGSWENQRNVFSLVPNYLHVIASTRQAFYWISTQNFPCTINLIQTKCKNKRKKMEGSLSYRSMAHHLPQTLSLMCLLLTSPSRAYVTDYESCI